MNLEKLYEILGTTTVMYRKGEEVEERREGSLQIIELNLMPHVSEASSNMEKIDCHFVVVGVDKKKAEQYREELIEILNAYPQPKRLAAGPSYIEVGAEIGDQGAAFRLFALGEVLGLWKIITPEALGFKEPEADILAGSGMVTIDGYKPHKKNDIIAVNVIEMKKYGCPYCGFRSGYSQISGGGASVWVCGECNKTYVALAKGVKKSPLGIGSGEITVWPVLQAHPRRGTPAHGSPDKRPEGGGEFFRSRGIGLDATPGCFVCGGKDGLRNNIAAFVQCKEAGERVVRMFKAGARLDYREYEPDYVQVKIGACKTHLKNLKLLHELVTKANGILKAEMIAKAIS